jgi:hypothetical protein
MHSWVNHARCGLDACFAWLAIMLAAGVWPEDGLLPASERDALTRVALAALPAAFATGAALSWLRWRWATDLAMRQFRAYLDQRVAGELAAFFPFAGPHEAVLVARRAARRWADREEGLLEADAPRMAGLVLAAASARFPQDPGVMLAQSAYAGRIAGDPARARSTAERAAVLVEAGGAPPAAGGAGGGQGGGNQGGGGQGGGDKGAASQGALAVSAAGVAGAGGGYGRPGFTGSDSDGALGALADRYAAFALARVYSAQAEAQASASGAARGVDLAAFLEAERQLRWVLFSLLFFSRPGGGGGAGSGLLFRSLLLAFFAVAASSSPASSSASKPLTLPSQLSPNNHNETPIIPKKPKKQPRHKGAPPRAFGRARVLAAGPALVRALPPPGGRHGLGRGRPRARRAHLQGPARAVSRQPPPRARLRALPRRRALRRGRRLAPPPRGRPA